MIIIAVAAVFTLAVMALLLSHHMKTTPKNIEAASEVKTASVPEEAADTAQTAAGTEPVNEEVIEEPEEATPTSENVEDTHRKKDEIISKIKSMDTRSKTDEVIDASDLGPDDAMDIAYGACRETELECCESKDNSEGSFSCITSGYIYDDDINNKNEEPLLRYIRFDYDPENKTLQIKSVHTPIDRSGGDVITTLEGIEKDLAEKYEGFYITIL